jgi:hypothetical protein
VVNHAYLENNKWIETTPGEWNRLNGTQIHTRQLEEHGLFQIKYGPRPEHSDIEAVVPGDIITENGRPIQTWNIRPLLAEELMQAIAQRKYKLQAECTRRIEKGVAFDVDGIVIVIKYTEHQRTILTAMTLQALIDPTSIVIVEFKDDVDKVHSLNCNQILQLSSAINEFVLAQYKALNTILSLDEFPQDFKENKWWT